jgi:hypothetical protein
MNRLRFLDQEAFAPVPVVSATGASANTFVVCPLALTQGWGGWPGPWRQIYELAYKRTQAALRPSLWERLQAVSWN